MMWCLAIVSFAAAIFGSGTEASSAPTAPEPDRAGINTTASNTSAPPFALISSVDEEALFSISTAVDGVVAICKLGAALQIQGGCALVRRNPRVATLITGAVHTLEDIEGHAKAVWKRLAPAYQSVVDGYALFVGRHPQKPSKHRQLCEVGVLLVQAACSTGHDFLREIVQTRLQQLGAELCQWFVKPAALAATRLAVVCALRKVLHKLAVSLVCLALRQLEKFIPGLTLAEDIPLLGTLLTDMVRDVNSRLGKLSADVLVPRLLPQLSRMAIRVWDRDVFPKVWHMAGPTTTALILGGVKEVTGTNPVQFATSYVSSWEDVVAAAGARWASTGPFEQDLQWLGCKLGTGMDAYVPGFDTAVRALDRSCRSSEQPLLMADALAVVPPGTVQAWHNGTCEEEIGVHVGDQCLQREKVTIDGRKYSSDMTLVWTGSQWVPVNSTLAGIVEKPGVRRSLLALVPRTLLVGALFAVAQRCAQKGVTVTHRVWWKWNQPSHRIVACQRVPLVGIAPNPPPPSSVWRCSGVAVAVPITMASLWLLQLSVEKCVVLFGVARLIT